MNPWVVNLYARARSVWTQEQRVRKVIQECSELILALSKHYDDGRGSIEECAEECADVLIVCEQLRLALGPELVDDWRQHKLARLDKRVTALESEK